MNRLKFVINESSNGEFVADVNDGQYKICKSFAPGSFAVFFVSKVLQCCDQVGSYCSLDDAVNAANEDWFERRLATICLQIPIHRIEDIFHLSQCENGINKIKRLLPESDIKETADGLEMRVYGYKLFIAKKTRVNDYELPMEFSLSKYSLMYPPDKKTDKSQSLFSKIISKFKSFWASKDLEIRKFEKGRNYEYLSDLEIAEWMNLLDRMAKNDI